MGPQDQARSVAERRRGLPPEDREERPEPAGTGDPYELPAPAAEVPAEVPREAVLVE